MNTFIKVRCKRFNIKFTHTSKKSPYSKTEHTFTKQILYSKKKPFNLKTKHRTRSQTLFEFGVKFLNSECGAVGACGQSDGYGLMTATRHLLCSQLYRNESKYKRVLRRELTIVNHFNSLDK